MCTSCTFLPFDNQNLNDLIYDCCTQCKIHTTCIQHQLLRLAKFRHTAAILDSVKAGGSNPTKTKHGGKWKISAQKMRGKQKWSPQTLAFNNSLYVYTGLFPLSLIQRAVYDIIVRQNAFYVSSSYYVSYPIFFLYYWNLFQSILTEKKLLLQNK